MGTIVKNKKREVLIIFGFIMTAIVVNLPVLFTNQYHKLTHTTKVVNGSIDLSGVSLADGKRVYLDGQWNFSWNELIGSEPNRHKNEAIMVDVPSEWSNYKVDGDEMSASGCGSYILNVNNISYEQTVTVYIPDFGSAYRVYIDGRLASESGKLSKQINEIFTSPKAKLNPIYLSKAKSHEIIIEVATTRFSGLYMTPILVDYQKNSDYIMLRDSIRFILFGIAIFSFISLIVLYILTVRSKLYSVWMPLIFFFILLRIMLTTEFYSFWQPIFFFNMSYEDTNELMYFVSFVLKYLLIFLVQEQCGIKFYKREKVGFLIFYIVLYLVYFLTPQDIYNKHFSVILPMFTFLLDIFLISKIYLWRDRLMKYGMLIFWGSILVIIGIAIDSYYINGKIIMDMSLVMLSLFLVFLTIMVGVNIMRVTDLYDDYMISSTHLLMARKQITMQKEHYDALSKQMQEIKAIKHDINHFIGVMNQLAKEGDYYKLKVFLSEVCEKASFDQLPVFCEHTIANSIIGYQYLQALEHGIKFNSLCLISNSISISDSDLCIILGNALENAVYACKQMNPTKRRFVTIESKNIKGQQLIKIINTYNGNLNIKHGQYMTLKTEGFHGLGIRNIEKVVQDYGGFIKIEHDENIFTLMVAIPIK